MGSFLHYSGCRSPYCSGEVYRLCPVSKEWHYVPYSSHEECHGCRSQSEIVVQEVHVLVEVC